MTTAARVYEGIARHVLRKATIGLMATFFSLSAGIANAQTSTVPLESVVRVSTSHAHGCAITMDGLVKCWGFNQRGELGDGSVNPRSIAAPAIGVAGAVSVSTGGATPGPSTNPPTQHWAHSCAVLSSGSIKCWGANDSGELGDGTTTDRAFAVDVVGLGASAVDVAAGGRHTCALTSSGGVKCWGANDVGQLGNGTTSQSSVPWDVIGLQAGVAKIAAGYRHTCALMNSGAVKCWGSNASGEIGDGTTVNRSVPTDVAGFQSGAMAIAAGGGANGWNGEQAGSESCVVTSGGGVMYWGHGKLVPFERMPDGGGAVAAACTTGNTLSGRPPTFFFRSCVLRANRTVQCWDLRSTQPQGINLSGSAESATGLAGPAAEVVTLAGFSSCARLETGRVQCWREPTSGSGATYLLTTASGLNPQAIVFIHDCCYSVPVGGTHTRLMNAGGSGNPVVFTNTTPSICSNSGTTITGLAQGKCIILADQAGNELFEPAPQARLELRIGDPVPQSITFGPDPQLMVGGSGTVSATASSGLEPVTFTSTTPTTCSVSGSVVSALRIGSCFVAASQAGDWYYAPAQAVRSIEVTGGTPPEHSLSVQIGTGAGTILSTPGAIDCPGVCAESLATGSTVRLSGYGLKSPSAPFTEYLLGSWAGDCTGLVCTLVMNSNKSVTANFVPYSGTLKPRYRLYSPATFEHLYTTDLNEYTTLPACCGWLPEGAIYYLFEGPGSIDGKQAVPLMRLYNPYSYQHHWTTNGTEYDVLASYGWLKEGIDGYLLPTAGAGTVALHRLYLNASGGLHLWTTDVNEVNVLTTSAGWVYEGIAGYVIPMP